MKAFCSSELQLTKAQACPAVLELNTPRFSGQENTTEAMAIVFGQRRPQHPANRAGVSACPASQEPSTGTGTQALVQDDSGGEKPSLTSTAVQL